MKINYKCNRDKNNSIIKNTLSLNNLSLNNLSLNNLLLVLALILSFNANITNGAIFSTKAPQNTQNKQDAKNTQNKLGTKDVSTEQIFKNPFHENIWGVHMQKKQPLQSFQTFANLTKKNKYAYKWLINFLHKTGNNQKLAEIYPLTNSAFPELLQNDPDVGFMVAYALCTSNVTQNTTCMPINCKPKNSTPTNCTSKNNTPSNYTPGNCTSNKNTQSNSTPSNCAANNCTSGDCVSISYNKDAMDILVPLNRNFPAHQQVSVLICTLYDLNNDPQNAITIAEKYLNMASAKPTDFLEFFKNSTRYLKIGDKKNALKNAKKCLDLQPKFPNGWVLLATIYDNMDKAKEAIDACKKALEITGPNQVIEYMIVRIFFKLKGAQHLVNEFVMNKKCFEKAVELLRQHEYDKALAHMDKCLAEHLKNNSNNNGNNNLFNKNWDLNKP